MLWEVHCKLKLLPELLFSILHVAVILDTVRNDIGIVLLTELARKTF